MNKVKEYVSRYKYHVIAGVIILQVGVIGGLVIGAKLGRAEIRTSV